MNNIINEGEYHMYEGQYELAIANFTEAFSLVDQPKARDYYLASKCYSQLSEEIEMLNYLELAVKGGLDKLFIESDSLWFSNYRFSNSYKSVLKMRPAKTDLEEDNESKNAFKDLHKKLNMIRIIKFFKHFDKRDSFPDKYNSSLKKYIPYSDSMTSQLVNFLTNYSLPNDKKEIRTLIVISQLFLSSEFSQIDTVKIILRSHLDNGDLTPRDFANIFEKLPLKISEPHKMSNGKYGLSASSTPKEDYEEIIENRKNIGLSTYYIGAPNYNNNYKPQPIDLIIKSKNTSQSSN